MAKEKNHFSYSCVATSLEELLIYVLISIILFLILLQFYGFIKHKLETIEQQMELLYKYHIADFFLKNHIIQAGYKGPATSWNIANYSSVNSSDYKQLVPLAAIAVCRPIVSKCKDFVTSKILNKISMGQIKSDTDILIVYDIPEKIEKLQESMLSYDGALKVSANFADLLTSGSQLIIADLQFSQRFVVSNIINQQIMHTKPYNFIDKFATTFEQGSEIFTVKHVAFYLAKDPRNNENPYHLYIDYLSSDLNANAHAIIDNIENFQVEVFDEIQHQIVGAAKFGWIFQKYILIKLSFKQHNISRDLVIGVDIRNV